MKKVFILTVLMLVFQSCKQNNFLDKTMYRGEIEAKGNLKIPFNFRWCQKIKLRCITQMKLLL